MIKAACATSASTRAARQTAAASLRHVANVAAWVAGPTLACDTEHEDVAAALAATTWRATHAACSAGAHAMLLIANVLLYTSYADTHDAAETDRQRAMHWLGLTFKHAARATTTTISAAL